MRFVVEASLTLGAEAGVRAGQDAPEQSFGPLEEAGPVEERIPDSNRDAVVSIVGAGVVDIVVFAGEDQTSPLEPDHE